MMMTMSRYRCLSLIGTTAALLAAVLLFSPALAFAQPSMPGGPSGPLVPCGVQGQTGVDEFCQICHLYTLAQRLLNFLWWFIAAPIAIVMLIWGGLFLLIPSASPSHIERGKKILSSALVGLLIIFVAWLGVDTVLKFLQFRGTGEGDTQFGPWNKINCPTVDIVALTPQQPALTTSACGTPQEECQPPDPQCTAECRRSTGGPTSIPRTGDPFVDALAQNQVNIRELRNTWGTPIQGGGDCRNENGSRVGPQTNAAELEAGRSLTVCSSGCDTIALPSRGGCSVREGTTVNPDLLTGMVVVQRDVLRGQGSFEITSISTGPHSSNSKHYSGNAIDLKPTGGASYRTLRDAFISRGINAFCDVRGVITACDTGQPGEHVHIER